MQFAGVTITPETVQLTREHFAALYNACASECQSGGITVNDPALYIDRCNRNAAQALSGRFDTSFTFMQRAHYLQTGDCVALLP